MMFDCNVDVPALPLIRSSAWLDGLSGEAFDSEWRKCSAIEKCSVTPELR